jgi:hypothetical protein
MFLVLFIVLLVAWGVGWFAFRAAGALIHLLLIVAVISLRDCPADPADDARVLG